MTRRELLAFGALALPSWGQRPGDPSGAARDLLNQALELLWERSADAEVRSALRLLNVALDENGSFGDAHYYRALCNRRLKLARTVESDLEAAHLYGSEALRDERDPFKLSAPRLLGDELMSVGQKWALVVGINRFQPGSGADPLRFAADDARAFADLLLDAKVGRFAQDNVFRLLDEQATTSAIKARLNRIATKAKPEDVVVIYLSTHGSPRADDLRQVSYLLTYDTNVSSRDQIFGTALPMVEVSGIVSTRCVALRTVVIFDTCHSGAALESRALSTADFDRLRAGAGRYVLSSCGETERSYEESGHGLFTASLISHLVQRAGCIRLTELFLSVQQDVAERAKRLSKAQRPTMMKSDDAVEIILGATTGSKSEGCLVG